MFSSKFHSKSRTRDLVRRRRWHRKMVQTDPTAPAVFQIKEEVGRAVIVVSIRMEKFLFSVEPKVGKIVLGPQTDHTASA